MNLALASFVEDHLHSPAEQTQSINHLSGLNIEL